MNFRSTEEEKSKYFHHNNHNGPVGRWTEHVRNRAARSRNGSAANIPSAPRRWPVITSRAADGRANVACSNVNVSSKMASAKGPGEIRGKTIMRIMKCTVLLSIGLLSGSRITVRKFSSPAIDGVEDCALGRKKR